MAASGYTPISLYYSSVSGNEPLNTNLVNGELAINIADGKLFYKDNLGAVQTLGGSSSGAPIGAIQYFAGTTSTTYPGSSWLKCDGSIVSQASYPELYSKIGTLADGFYSLQNTILNTVASLTGETVYAINFVGSQYVAVGASGFVATSTNGTTWTQRNSGIATDLYNFTYDGTKIIAVGASTTVITSTDAITWSTATTSGLSGSLCGIAYTPSLAQKYVICNGNRTDNALGNAVYSSTDGITWTSRTTSGRSWCNVNYVNSLYVATGNGVVARSTDGITWASSAPPVNSYNAAVGPISYINSKYIFTATAGNAAAVTATSTDLITWTTQTGDATTTGGATAVSDGSAVYIYGSAGYGLKTTDAVTFTKFNTTISERLYASVYNSGNYLFGGASAQVRTSTDGTTWSSFSLLYSASNGSLVVSAGAAGSIATTTNGTTWTTRTSGATTNLYNVRYLSDNKFWYVGATGALGNSTDGITWSTVTSGTSSTIYDITYGGGKYIAAGAAGLIKTSTDGTTWTAQASFSGYDFTNVTYFNNKYFAFGPLSKTSTDGVTWETLPIWEGLYNNSYYCTSVVKNAALYVAFPITGYGTFVLKTTNGTVFDIVLSTMPINTAYRTIGCTYLSAVGDYLVLSGGATTYGNVNTQTLTISKDGINWSTTPYTQYNGYVTVVGLGNKIIACGSGVVGTANMYSYSTGTDFALPKNPIQFCATNSENSAYIKAL